MKATWNNIILAESDHTVLVEGNHYFPPESIKKEYFIPTKTNTVCPWKGVAHYYTIQAGDQQNIDAAWHYPDTSELAKNIKGYVAFWKGVKISND